MSDINKSLQPTEDSTLFCYPSTELFRKTGVAPQACITVITGPQSGEFYYVNRKNGVTVGSSVNADIQISDKGISRMHMHLSWSGNNTFLTDLQSANGTFLNGSKITDITTIKDGDQIIIGSTTTLKFNISNQLDIDYQQRIHEQATLDSLTRAYNKRALIEYLHREFCYAKRNKSSVCVLMIDIDYFKNINDTYGHVVGDYALIHLVNTLCGLSRAEDYVCRFGGEEFTIICRNLNLHMGYQFAKRILETVDFSYPKIHGEKIHFTVSIGVSSYPEDHVESISALINYADTALYNAKRNGRNRIETNMSNLSNS